MKSAVIALATVLLAVIVVAEEPPKLGPLFAVHIDTVERGHAAKFEELIRKQSATRRDILNEHHVDAPPAWEIATSDGVYLTFRGRASLTDFDKPSAIPDDVRKMISEKAGAFDAEIHAQLHAHHSEIWYFDAAGSVLPAGVDWHRAPTFVRLRKDVVRPAKDDDYAAAMKEIRTAIAATTQPVAMLAFESGYGGGGYRYLLLSAERVSFESLVSRKLLRRLAACVVESGETDATARPDLTATDPGSWLH